MQQSTCESTMDHQEQLTDNLSSLQDQLSQRHVIKLGSVNLAASSQQMVPEDEKAVNITPFPVSQL